MLNAIAPWIEALFYSDKGPLQNQTCWSIEFYLPCTPQNGEVPLHPVQSRCCFDKDFLLLLKYAPTRPIILSPNVVSVKPKVKQMQTFIHAQAGALHWTPTVVHVSELKIQLSPLCWAQGIIDFRGDGITPCFFFYRNKHQKSCNEKKNKLHRLFKHYYCYYHSRHHLCYQQGLTAPKCCCTSCWSLPWVSTFYRGGKSNQPKIWEKERELREANFHTVTEKEIC